MADSEEEVLAPAAFDQSIDEFCASLSVADTRVEMIGAFHAEEKREARLKDTAENYQARFEAFTTRPVQ